MQNESQTVVVEEQSEVVAAELPEITESHLVFDHAPASAPKVCPSASLRAL